MSEEAISEIRERIVKLETEYRHMEAKLDSMSVKVTEVHELLMQARGARWMLMTIMLGLGGVVGYLSKYIPILGGR